MPNFTLNSNGKIVPLSAELLTFDQVYIQIASEAYGDSHKECMFMGFEIQEPYFLVRKWTSLGKMSVRERCKTLEEATAVYKNISLKED